VERGRRVAAGRQVADYPGGVPVPPDDLAADIGTLAREG
jgi:hypothetical protein